MATMLLISSDPTLVASVEETVATIDALDLEVVEDVDQAGLSQGRAEILVVVYHLNEARSVTGLTRMLQEIVLRNVGSACSLSATPIVRCRRWRCFASEWRITWLAHLI